MTQTSEYEFYEGFQPNHEQATVGYGLTLENIYHWLDNQKSKLAQVFMADNLSETLPQFTPKDSDLDIEQSGDTQFIYYPAFVPGQHEVTLSPVSKINDDIYATLIAALGHSTELDPDFDDTDVKPLNSEQKAALKQFINDYAGYIETCEYC